MKKVGGVSKGEKDDNCTAELNKIGKSGRENGRPLLSKLGPASSQYLHMTSAIESYLCSGIQIESLEAKMSTDAEDNLQLEMAVDMILKF